MSSSLSYRPVPIPVTGALRQCDAYLCYTSVMIKCGFPQGERSELDLNSRFRQSNWTEPGSMESIYIDEIKYDLIFKQYITISLCLIMLPEPGSIGWTHWNTWLCDSCGTVLTISFGPSFSSPRQLLISNFSSSWCMYSQTMLSTDRGSTLYCSPWYSCPNSHFPSDSEENCGTFCCWWLTFSHLC